MSEQFSWHRLKALLRNESVGEYRSWLIASGVTAGALLIGAIIAVNGSGPDAPYYRFAFFPVLMIWGTIQSSLAFSDLNDKSKNTAYLLLPASALEKTLAPLLTTTIVLIAYLLAFTALASVVIEGINWLLYRRTNDLFDPFDPAVWESVPRYLVTQSWFFLGAAWFRKAHYLKTLLVIFVGGPVLVGLALLTTWISGVIAFTPDGIEPRVDVDQWLFLPNPWLADALPILGMIVGFVVVPAFCWFVAWLRVTETQVSHGV
jgi:hypothetical protein